MTTQTEPSILTIEAIRAQFPALRRAHEEYSAAYFDGPGGTQVPESVSRALEDYLLNHNANTNWNYRTSVETDELLAAARLAYADFFNSEPSEVVFGQNMTTLTFHLSRALGRDWGPGDEIVVTQLDHMANRTPWQVLADERGVTIRTVPMTLPTGELDWVAFEAAVSDRTRLVAVGGASNAIGTVNDLRRASRLARSVGALLFVDAVHQAHHALPDVRDIDCDFLACSPYKFYGPHLGVLYVRHSVGKALEPARLPCAASEMPEKFETGTLNHECIVGAAAAVDFLAGLATTQGSRRQRLHTAFRELHVRGTELVRRLWDGLEALDGATVYGLAPEADRTSTVAFTIEGIESATVARRLSDEWGIFTSHGDFYASGVAEAFGLGEDGFVRVGCACYSTAEEIDRLLEGLYSIT